MLLRVLLSVAVSTAALAAAGPARAGGPVDLRARRIDEDGVTAPIGPGRAQVKLTLDPAWQRAAERLLARSGAHEGAIVASDVRTGRILAWASRGDRDYVAAPLAPPASLFKIATAAALIEGGHASAATTECWAGGGERGITERDLEARGRVCATLGEALGHSHNLVFARQARRELDAAELRRMAAALGLTGALPIDAPVGAGDAPVPDDPLGMARAAAGFGAGKITPLGALFAMQTIANLGEQVRLSLLDATPARVVSGRAVGAATARSLGRMLEVTTARGTCARAFRRPDGSRALGSMAVAAKTGTLLGASPRRMYSWFAAFAPARAPEVAVAVMLANDMRWRTKANLVGREMLEAWFEPTSRRRAARSAPGRRR